MTVMEAITQVDSLKPNSYSQKQKIIWLSRVEAMVKRLIIDKYEGGEKMTFAGFREDTDPKTVLLMPEPFDEAYIRWLEAQIHYANEEIDLYNNAMMMFNTAFESYKNDYAQNHTAKGCGRFLF